MSNDREREIRERVESPGPYLEGFRRSDMRYLLDQLAAARRLLFLTHPCDGKYGDDGEMQCNRCMIDFKRDPMEVIDGKIATQRLQNVDQLTAAPDMYAALKAFVAHYPNGINPFLDEAWNAARAALAAGDKENDGTL